MKKTNQEMMTPKSAPLGGCVYSVARNEMTSRIKRIADTIATRMFKTHASRHSNTIFPNSIPAADRNGNAMKKRIMTPSTMDLASATSGKVGSRISAQKIFIITANILIGLMDLNVSPMDWKPDAHPLKNIRSPAYSETEASPCQEFTRRAPFIEADKPPLECAASRSVARARDCIERVRACHDDLPGELTRGHRWSKL